MREANRITRQIISATQAALLYFRPSIQWERNAVEVELVNVGKVGAPDVTASIEFLCIRSADGAVLQDSKIQIRKSILASGDGESRYIAIDTAVSPNAAENMPRFDSEYWKFVGSFDYDDGFGNYRPQSICSIQFVEKQGNGWGSTWQTCEDWKVLREPSGSRKR
jgi:hypothetical protein